MAEELINNISEIVSVSIPPEILEALSGISLLINILQALGVIILIYFIFSIIGILKSRKDRKLLLEINKKLDVLLKKKAKKK